MTRSPHAALAFAAIAALSWGSVALALYTQYQWDMQPCPWCVLQRLLFVLIGAAALAGLAWRRGTGQFGAALAVSTLATAGMAAALWQHFVAAASASCNLTLADRIMAATGLDRLWPEVFAAYASCAEAQARLAGIPYEFWSLALFALLELAGAWLLLQAMPRAGAARG